MTAVQSTRAGVGGVAVALQWRAFGRCCQPQAGPSFTCRVQPQTQTNQLTKNREVHVCVRVCARVCWEAETGARQVKEKTQHSKSCMWLV